MNKDEALRLALEALEEIHGIDTETECVTIDVEDVINTIKQALETKDEPVAWMYDWTTSEGDFIQDWTTSEAEMLRDTKPTIITNVRPLYTTPQRKPLTDEQITEIYTEWESKKGTSWADLIRAVESAHGIKE